MVRKRTAPQPSDPAAGNGILSRRIFLQEALIAGSAGLAISSASAEPLTVPTRMKVPGAGFAAYGRPSRIEDKVVRAILSPPNPTRRQASALHARRCTCSTAPSRRPGCTSSASSGPLRQRDDRIVDKSNSMHKGASA
jgi:hypothetical protein